jgi:hypothetical protein
VTNVPTPAPLVAIDLCFERLGKVRVLNLDERKEEDIVAADRENTVTLVAPLAPLKDQMQNYRIV